MIDTHCHLFFDRFQDDFGQLMQRAADAGTSHIFMPAITLDSLEKMAALDDDNIKLHNMAGLHPTEINEGASISEQDLHDALQKYEAAAVGETGLDYYWSEDFKPQQRRSLRMHCKVAKAVEKPIVLHNRASTSDLLQIIDEEQDGRLKGIWHCFNGTAKEGKRAIDLGLHLGIGGMLTFNNADIGMSVAELPLEKMVLETDAPYLAPEPHRGERNEPAFVKYVAEKLADVKQTNVEDIISTTDENALSLFDLT